MIDTIKLLVAGAALVLPMYGLLGWRSRDYRLETLGLAVPLALAAMLILGSGLAYCGGLMVFFPVWGIFALLVLWLSRKDWKKKWSLQTLDWPAAAAGVMVFLFQAIPVAMQEFPAGWDPACHALIAEKIRLSGVMCADWRPFEDLPMLYPQCFHVFTALLAQLTGCSVHAVLQNFHLLFSFPATIILWQIAEKIGGRRAGLFALFACAFLTDTGNYFYFYRMGMLPTECANLLFLGMLLLLLRRDWMLPEKWLAGMLCGAGIFLVHPLSGVISACVFSGVAYFCRDREVRRVLVSGVAGGLVSLGAYLLSVAGIASRGNTESIKFAEEPAMPFFHVLEEIGWSVLPLAGVGLWFAWKRRGEMNVRLAMVWLAVLTGIFCGMEYGFRYGIAKPFFGEDFTIGIPSRFIAVSGSAFCVWAGVGMDKLSRLRRGWIFIVVFGMFCLSGVWRYVVLAQQENVPAELRDLAAVVRRNTPEHAYFLLPSQTISYQWFSYLAWRASLGVPIPSSENRAQLIGKWQLFSDLDGNREKLSAYFREHQMICIILLQRAPGRWQMAQGMPDGRFRLLRQELKWHAE